MNFQTNWEPVYTYAKKISQKIVMSGVGLLVNR